MSNKKLMKKVLVISLSATMVFAIGSSVYASTQALPNGTIVNQNGTNYLTDSNGQKYSGWFKDSNEDWYYFNESDKSMKTGWHHDDKDGYWYYLNLSDGKMATDWQTIDGKEYFFQPVRDMGNYNFNNEQEKWLYSINSKVPYGAMYVNTTTPDGAKVDSTGAKIITTENNNQDTAQKTVKNGWVSQNGKWYYYESDVMAKNKWLNLSGKWYYVDGDGVMVSDRWREIDGKSYYFGSDGAMYVNTTTPDGFQVDSNGLIIDSVNKNNGINYDDFIGIFREPGNAQMTDMYWLNGYLDITEIKNDRIYGTYEQHSIDSCSADFTQGLELIGDTFTINMNYDDWGKHALAYGLPDNGDITDTFPVICKLSYKDGNPMITMNGKSNKHFPSPYENVVIPNFDNFELIKAPL